MENVSCLVRQSCANTLYLEKSDSGNYSLAGTLIQSSMEIIQKL